MSKKEIHRWKNSECEEEKTLTTLIVSLMNTSDKTFYLEFIMYLNILISCNHFRKNIKMATNRDCKKSHRTDCRMRKKIQKICNIKKNIVYSSIR